MAGSGGSVSFGFKTTSKKSSVVSSTVRIDDSSSKSRNYSENDDEVVTDIGNTDLRDGNRKEKPKEYIIPLIKPSKRKASVENGQGGKKKEKRELTDLEKEAMAELAHDAEEADREAEDDRAVPMLMQNRLDKGDPDSLGDVSTLDEYDDMPIESFGQAMLRGMGWKPGVGVGKTNKKEVKPVEFIPHSGGRGLGAEGSSVVESLTGKPKSRRLRPGEVRKTEKQLPVDADGRIRHTRHIDETLEDKEDLELKVGSRCLVQSGRHKGLYGKVVSLQMDPPRVVVRLALNERNVDISQLAVVTVPRREYDQKALSVAKDDDASGNGSEGKASRRSEPDKSRSGRSNPDERRDDRGSRRDDRRGDGDRDSERSGHRDRDREREDDRSRHHHQRGRDSPSPKDSEPHKHRSEHKKKKKKKQYSDEERCDDVDGKSALQSKPWLASQLRVRMVDQRYSRGHYYNTKMIVEDVLSPTVCTCRSETGTVLDNVHQDMLETVVPRDTMASVMVVGGQHRRQLGRMLSRDKSAGMAVVQLYPDFETVEVSFDDVCEYIGRTEHL